MDKERRKGLEQAHGYAAHLERWMIKLGFDPKETKHVSTIIEIIRLEHAMEIPEFYERLK